MSSYHARTRHPKTGKICNASWIDDAFGRHQYGVQFPGEEVLWRPEEVKLAQPGEYDLGDEVCDMHDGLPDGAIKHFRIDTNASTEALHIIVEKLGNEVWLTNKIAYVIGEHNDGYQCAYSYDGRTLGFFVLPYPAREKSSTAD